MEVRNMEVGDMEVGKLVRELEDKANEAEGISISLANNLLFKHEDALKSAPSFSKGQLVEKSKLTEITGSPLEDEQLAIVEAFGREAVAQTQNPYTNTIILFVDIKTGKLARAAVSASQLQRKIIIEK